MRHRLLDKRSSRECFQAPRFGSQITLNGLADPLKYCQFQDHSPYFLFQGNFHTVRWDIEQTICAIASGSTSSSRGIIRLTGSEATEILLAICEPSDRLSVHPRRAGRYPVSLRLPSIHSAVPSFAQIWPERSSYTGQPSVEIHTIGSPPILEDAIEALTSQGARLADPGEFTFRAYLSGRLDLSQCEAVLGVIHAQSDEELALSLQQLAGGIQLPVRNAREQLIDLLADLEAGLDFVDEDIEFISQEMLRSRLETILRDLRGLESKIRNRRIQTGLPEVVLVGHPNAGKSSLLNRLVCQNAAIVSDSAGTTRDVLRKQIQLSSGSVLLCDTAGIEDVDAHPSTSEGYTPREIAQQVGREQFRRGKLLLLCIDARSSDNEIVTALESLQVGADQELWILLTQTDRLGDDWQARTTKIREILAQRDSQTRHTKIVPSSIFSDDLIGEIKEHLGQWLADQSAEMQTMLPLTSTRCLTALRAAIESIDRCVMLSEERLGDELVSAEIRIALDELSVVAGQVHNEDILDALFGRFCIGK